MPWSIWTDLQHEIKKHCRTISSVSVMIIGAKNIGRAEFLAMSATLDFVVAMQKNLPILLTSQALQSSCT